MASAKCVLCRRRVQNVSVINGESETCSVDHNSKTWDLVDDESETWTNAAVN